MSYGDILLMILTSQKALASIGSQCLFLSLVLLLKQVQIIVQINYKYKNMYDYHTNSEHIFL